MDTQHNLYWPAVHPVEAMTPRAAWIRWQAGTITREEFTAALEAWQ